MEKSGDQPSDHSVVPIRALRTGWQNRGYLPHLRADGGTYFVTFRLADALPAEVLAALRVERKELEKQVGRADGNLSKAQLKRLRELYEDRIQSHLDAGHGKCWLKYPAIGGMVAQSLRHFAGERYVLHAWVVMGNHVHAVVTPNLGHPIESILHSWKSFTAHEVHNVAQASRLQLPKNQPFWQRESYEGLIHDDAEFVSRCEYTIQNPVMAGLCDSPEDWPLSSASTQPSPEM